MEDSQSFTILNEELWRSRNTAEYEAFAIITREVSDKKNVFADSVVVNSLAIRPYVPVKRPFSDLDMAFPSQVPFDKILQIASDLTGYTEITPMPEPNMSLHVKYHSLKMRETDLTGGFSIHLHSCGVWYKNTLFDLDDAFFDSKHWAEVPAAADVLPVLPVPKLEELFLLKLRKFLGFDKIDILSMLCVPNIDIPYIDERACKLGIIDRTVANLENVKANCAAIMNQWSHEHLLSMSDEAKDRIIANLDKLLASMKCQH